MANALLLLGCGSGGSGVLTPPNVAPVLDVSADLGSDTANLQWTASNKTSSAGFGYRIYRKISPAVSFTELTTTTNRVYEDVTGETTPETSYEYYIEPYNDAGEGPISNEVSILLPGEGEAPVLSGPGQAQENETFTLNWNDISGATEYHLERSTDNITFGPLTTTALLTFDTSEAATGNYYYRVTPFAGAFEGLHSNVWQVNITLPPPLEYTYLRPGGVDGYRRPGGTDLYIRP
jgi:fibronectin type 3 domain-containing protein